MLKTQNSPLKTPFGLYVHVPFCAAKCPYCDFYSGRDTALLPAYVNAVTEELLTLRRSAGFADETLFSRPLGSVYFGGGTPFVLPAEALAEILHTVKSRYALSPDAEITAEVNPTLKEPEAWFAAAAEAGVNRVSVGMQSALDAERKALGRRGTAADVKQTVFAAKQAGISNISVDLMLGIPGQTKESLQQSLDFALSLGITHLSVYILKIEPGTVFDKRKDSLNLPDEEETADLYLFTAEYLKAQGMRHYEISNFCFGDLVGRHNFNYWQCCEYLGVGPAAHSFLNGRRFYYERDLQGFIKGLAPVDDGPGGDADEVFMLALRTDEGLDLPAYCARFGVSPPRFYEKIKEYGALGLAEYKAGRLTLTARGFLLSNTVISELLSVI